MGRKRIERTPEEIQARNRRYWGDAHNQKRRERYHADAEYRQRAIQQVRNAYRRGKEIAGMAVRLDDCRDSIPNLQSIGNYRELVGGAYVLAFSVAELSTALHRNVQVVYRWIKAGMFPEPVLVALNSQNRKQSFYSVDEVLALLTVFGNHLTLSQYYHEYHIETRNRLFASVAEFRKPRGSANGYRIRTRPTPACHSAA